VHAVGDGAPWIVGQIAERFGEQGSCLIDFNHVCEYLSAAAKTNAPDAAAGIAWMEAQKDALKTGRADAVLAALDPHREAADVSDDQAPVRVCHRYLGARKDQLNYREALAQGLPIGSGEIESVHRYVAQKRLKLPGAWWLVEHAEHMLALRINRLNGDWDAYWAALAANTPAPANLNRPDVSPNVAARLHNFGSHPAALRASNSDSPYHLASPVPTPFWWRVLHDTAEIRVHLLDIVVQIIATTHRRVTIGGRRTNADARRHTAVQCQPTRGAYRDSGVTRRGELTPIGLISKPKLGLSTPVHSAPNSHTQPGGQACISPPISRKPASMSCTTRSAAPASPPWSARPPRD